MTDPKRMTPEELAKARDALATGRKRISYVFLGRDLLRELDAVTNERDLAETANARLHSALILAVKERTELQEMEKMRRTMIRQTNTARDDAKMSGVPYWFILLCVTAEGSGPKADEAREALGLLTRAVAKERLAEIRESLEQGLYMGHERPIVQLLAELDAVTKERDEARKELSEVYKEMGVNRIVP